MRTNKQQCGGPVGPPRRPFRSWATLMVLAISVVLLLAAGCAKYNTYYNAKRSFDEAERLREESIKAGTDVETASRGQRQKYLLAVDKAKKLLRDYPGHSLTDDALFLMGKSYQRLASYRESIRRLDQLFINFPATDYMEEAIFLQAVNYLMLGNAARSQEYLDRLETQFPESRFRPEALRSSGDNAFALKDWEAAVTAYSRFLERYPDADDWDQSSLRLAEALWELDRYAEAATVLDGIADRSTHADRVFLAGLLEARCRARLGENARADELISKLKNEAEFYQKQGDVTLVEAENLLAAGDLAGGMAMLEGMPQEQQNADVKPVRADLLARAYLKQGELEKAREMFQQAVGGGDRLDDPDGTRLLFDTIKDYLAAEGQLPDADPPRAARLRLIKANAMLFGFDRPRQALDLYAGVAADTAADTTVAPRALYGAMLVYENWIDAPDSAAVFRDELRRRFPLSAQSYQADAGPSADLLGYLLEREEQHLAALRADSTGLDLASLGGGEGSAARRGTGLRRQTVYLQRRANLVYPPPEAALLALTQARAGREAAADSVAAAAAAAAIGTPAERPAFDLLPESLRPKVETAPTVAAPGDTSLVTVPADSVGAAAQPPAKAETGKKEKKRSWDL
ncbi:MAG: tetratricopeptide repeat protein [Candidatus Krumholzibacteriia bacterium]